ncbi:MULTISPECIES: rhodanese-like domain-containing protein [Marichromatium]|uniref:Rhodanese-like domain-containing protein n=1 Tax=Marichromatium gracile TaxID=1048 RepID=A0A4R4A9E0_MARGR|nr:rhodanese-like domain-containing protein [Marichromatium gracile]MBK1708022.1 sulfurtransferase [Marichromatium gracile]TCW35149.1 rhodanese-like domain-containing protein [Marichromatium gracile]
MHANSTLILVALTGALGVATAAPAAENRISPEIESVTVTHQGESVTIARGHDRDATLPEAFQKTDRGCPPFCVQPMVAVPGVETIGELELLDYLKRIEQGDDNILVVDSRTPDWVLRGTIPGSVNIPWNTISRDNAGTFETPTEADTFHHVLADTFAAEPLAGGGWDFGEAKTLVLFCNGIWCPQSTANIKNLVEIGYPLHKLKWYRGGMQDWVSVGLTTVTP